MRAPTRGREAPAGGGERVVSSSSGEPIFFFKKSIFQDLPGGLPGGLRSLFGPLGGQFGFETLIGGPTGRISVARFRLRSGFGQLRPAFAEFRRAEALKKRV